jgi:two-component sensor histidine kinase/CHASE3 domain sensor protein
MTARFSILNVLLMLSLLALVACVVTIVLAARAELRFREQEMHSSRVIEALDSVIVLALNAESGQRGYMLTGDKAYLEPYERAIGEFRISADTVGNLLEGELTPSQEAATAELQKWTGVKVVELSSTTELFAAGNVAGAMRLVRTDTGKTAMDNIRQNIALLIEEERALLGNARSETRRARLLVLVCVIALSVLSLFGFALALRNLQRSQKLGVVEEQARQLEEERERTDLLARELNHRVKNLFAIVQSIISSTARQETDARVAATKIRERVYALSRAHSLTSSIDMQQQTTLAALINAVVASQVSDYCDLHTEGPEVTIMAQHVTSLGMILHELTTNAVKYGAGSCDGGHIQINWSIHPEDTGKELHINWKEICGPDMNLSAPGPDGFGTRMMTISLSQLRGQSLKEWTPEGLNLRITLPLDGNGAVKDRN